MMRKYFVRDDKEKNPDTGKRDVRCKTKKAQVHLGRKLTKGTAWSEKSIHHSRYGYSHTLF